jgi:hypothetical protein
MSHTALDSIQTNVPTAIRPTTLRTGLALVVFVAMVAFAARASAQAPTAESAKSVAVAAVPFTVGEELVFHATFGKLSAGTARMRVEGIDTVRGRTAYHVVFSIDGGIPFYRVHDRYESWIDRETLSSLRHVQQISEGRYKRNTTYEIFPDRAEFQKNDEAPQASVANPLDDGSFIYAIRAAAVRVGETRRDDRYFRPDRNPVVLTGLRDDTVTVRAGKFATTVVRPTIKTGGIFAENGEAQVWFTNDERRLPVQLKTKFAKFSLTLALESVTIGDLAIR